MIYIPLYSRTDVAVEALKGLQDNNLSGVAYREEIIDGFTVSCVSVFDESASAALGKDIGYYITFELQDISSGGSDFDSAAVSLASLLRRCFKKNYSSFFIAAIGNPDITPDALGSLSASHIIATRHLAGKDCLPFLNYKKVSVCRTGVLGTTGIESSAHIKALCDFIHPDCVIVIDALAGSDADRLCKTIQITDTGISPGSGVGNNRARLDEATLGIPVISIGMPTVIDAGTLSDRSELSKMFVTPRDIDQAVRIGGKLIGYAVDLAIHDGLTVSDVELLLG